MVLSARFASANTEAVVFALLLFNNSYTKKAIAAELKDIIYTVLVAGLCIFTVSVVAEFCVPWFSVRFMFVDVFTVGSVA